jgi:hypothetical protein
MPSADRSVLVARVTRTMLFIKAMGLYFDWLAAGKRRPWLKTEQVTVRIFPT